MENTSIADMFEEIADLLAFDDANPYRVRAYRRGAATVRKHAEAMKALVEKGVDLKTLPAIGEDLSALIEEAVRTGRMQTLETLRRTAPAMVGDLVALEGIGPKKARALWQTLGITSVEQLYRAVLDHRVRTVPGFGAASERRLGAVLAGRGWSANGRTPLVIAAPIVTELTAYLDQSQAIKHVEIAGSFRRGKATVGDLDVVVVAKDAGSAIAHFTNWTRARRTVLAGRAKATIILDTGLQVDLRVTDTASRGAMLQYFTGSKSHSVALRVRARRKGLKLNEYGVWRGKKRIAGASEADVYAALGLDLIPPELRENRGEIELAAAHALPTLLTERALKGDLHAIAATPASAIALIKSAATRGFSYLGVGPHISPAGRASQSPHGAIAALFEAIDMQARKHARLHVFKTVEVDIGIDGTLQTDALSTATADLVIGSVQHGFDLSRAAQTKRLLRALDDQRLSILSHPTGHLVARRTPYDLDMTRIAEAAARRGVALELSADPDRFDLTDAHCLIARAAGARILLSAEAQAPADFDRLTLGVLQARRGWLSASHVLNTLPRTQIDTWAKRRRQSATAPCRTAL